MIKPIFFTGMRGQGKSVSMEYEYIKFLYEQEILKELFDMTNCEKHKKLWGKELLIPLWISNVNEQIIIPNTSKGESG